jgi:multicomponent Na+:H+ antiporter subunit B
MPSVLSAVVVLCVVVFTLLPLVRLDRAWPVVLRDHLELRGVQESGARNLVSAIYLGYRAFDTLGETIVLLVAVSGTIGMIAGASGFQRQERPKGQRTELIDVVTGKLGPVVLIFGLYVMLFGHLSPGGGFQGGVVVASGIVFLALGSRSGGRSGITEPVNLARMEAIGFLLLVLASLAGSFTGAGYFGNPLARGGISPVAYIIALNAVIGLKVGAGISLMCMAMLGESGS